MFTQLSISCKPFGLYIKMNFIASIKGHKDDRLKIWFEIFFSSFDFFFLCVVHSHGCNQTIYKTHCVRSLKKLTQPIKSCILRLSSKKRACPNISWMCGFALLLLSIFFSSLFYPMVCDLAKVFSVILFSVLSFCAWNVQASKYTNAQKLASRNYVNFFIITSVWLWPHDIRFVSQ